MQAQPASLGALPPPDGARRGKGRSERGRPHTPEPSSWEGGAEDRGSSATSARAGEGRRKSELLPTATDSETPPAPISPETAPRPVPHTRCPDREPQPGRLRLSPPPAPAGRKVREALGRELSRPSHCRGARRASPPPLEDDVDAEEAAAAAEACCCLAHSPPLNSHPTSGRDGVKRRRRWYFRVALPEPSAAQAAPQPRGHLEDSGLPRRSAPARRIGCFGCSGPGRPARTGARPPGSLLPSGLEAAAYPTVTWNPGTRVPTRIIVACPPPGCSVSLRRRGPVSGGSDGQDLTREEAAPAPRSAASPRRCRAARTRRWGEAGA